MKPGHRSRIFMRYPFAARVGRSEDGTWDFRGENLSFAGARVQREKTGKCLCLWFGPFAIWLVRANPLTAGKLDIHGRDYAEND